MDLDRPTDRPTDDDEFIVERDDADDVHLTRPESRRFALGPGPEPEPEPLPSEAVSAPSGAAPDPLARLDERPPPPDGWLNASVWLLLAAGVGVGAAGVGGAAAIMLAPPLESTDDYMGYTVLSVMTIAGFALFGFMHAVAAWTLARRQAFGWYLGVALGGFHCFSSCPPLGLLMLAGMLREATRRLVLDERRPPPPGTGRGVLVVSVLATIALAVTASAAIVGGYRRLDREMPSLAAGERHQSAELNYTLDVPAGGWRRVDGGYHADYSDLYLSRMPSLSFELIAERSDYSARRLADWVQAERVGADATVTVRGERTLTVDGAPAVLRELHARDGFGTTHYWAVTLHHRGIDYEMLLWCDDDESRRNRGLIDRFVDGFAFIDRADEERWETRAGPDGSFTFEAPVAPWVEVVDEERPSYFFYRSPDATAAISILVEEDRRHLGRFTDDVLAVYEKSETAPRRLAERAPEQVEGEPAWRLLFATREEAEGRDRELMVVVTVAGGRGYRFHLTAESPEALAAARPTLDRLIASARLDRTGEPGLEPGVAYPVADDEPPARTLYWRRRSAVLEKAERVWSSPDGAWIDACVVSPDGTWLAVHHSGRLELVELATGASRPLAREGTGSPAWAPDGARLVWTEQQGQVMAAEPPDWAPRATGWRGIAPRAGPDDTLAALHVLPSEPALSTVRWREQSGAWHHGPLDAPERARPLAGAPAGALERAALSPAGDRLAITVRPELPTGSATRPAELVIVALDGATEPVRPALARGLHDSLGWSADGARLVYARTNDTNANGVFGENGDRRNVYVLDLASGKEIDLTRSDGHRLPSLSASGELYFVNAWDGARGTGSHVWRIPLQTAIAQAEELPAWPTDLTAERADALADALRAALGEPTAPLPDAAAARAAAEAFARAVREHTGRALDFEAASLEVLHELLDELWVLGHRRPAIVRGAGAYYGETVRRALGGRWALEASRPLHPRTGTGWDDSPWILAIYPFAEVHAFLNEDDASVTTDVRPFGPRARGREIVLAGSSDAARAREAELAGADGARLRALWAEGEREEALALIERLLAAHPENRALRHALAGLLATEGRADRYRALLERGVAGDADDALSRVDLAVLLLEEAGGAGRAETLLREAVRLRPDLAASYYHLARCHRAQGRVDAARACLRRTLDLGGGALHDDAERMLAELGSTREE